MAARRQPLLEHVHRLAARLDPEADAVLLDRFVRQRDNAAFEALVHRHGTMVLGVCRRVLGNAHDAEDVFQAVFLVLSRKAASGRPLDSLPAWLHGVARRLALKHRQTQKCRQKYEARSAQAAGDPPRDPLDQLTAREMVEVLDEELQRLPVAYRLPLILCCLEGRMQEEAAEMLGWTPGSVKGRLQRGRALLYTRLARRGVAMGIGLLAATTLGQGAVAGLPAGLTRATVEAALRFAVGEKAGIATGVMALAEGAMRMTGKKMGAVLLGLTLAVAAAGGGLGFLLAKAPETRPEKGTEPVSLPEAAGIRTTTRLDCFGDPLPVDALGRMGTTRLRHTGLTHVLFAPDGKTVASEGADDTVRLWDIATGKLVRSLKHPPRVRGPRPLFFAPDGKTLISTTLNQFWLWDVKTGKQLRAWKLKLEPNQQIFTLALSSDGRRAASDEEDGVIRLWDMATGDPLLVLRGQGHGRPLHSLSFSADNKMLAAVANGEKQTVQLWDVSSGKLLHILEHPVKRIWTVCFSSDGKTLASGGSDKQLSANPEGNPSAVRLWDAATGKLLRILEGHQGAIVSLSFSANGKILASGSWDQTIRLWDVATGKELRKLKCQPALMVRSLAFTPDSTVLASGDTGSTVRLWDVATGAELHRPAGVHTGTIRSIAFAPNGRTLATAAAAWREGEAMVRLWAVASGKALHKLEHPEKVHAVVLAPDGKTLALGGASAVRLWDITTGKPLRRLEAQGGLPLAFSPDGKLLATGYNGAAGLGSSAPLQLWDVTTGTPFRVLKHRGRIPFAVFSPDSKTLAVGTQGATLFLWDVAAGKELRKVELDKSIAGLSRITILSFSPDGKTLALEGQGRNCPSQIYLVEMSTGKVFRTLTGHVGRVLALAFSPSGRQLASGGDDQAVQLWEINAGLVSPCHQFHGHEGRITALAFSPDGRRLASASRDSTVLVWDVTGQAGRPSRARRLTSGELTACWQSLINTNAARAYQARRTLAAAPEQTIPFLAERLREQVRKRPDSQQTAQVARLLADLDSEDFRVRSQAARELAKEGEAIEPALQQALKGNPSLEVRRHIKQLLDAMHPEGVSLGLLRGSRALEVLEWIDNPASRELLRKLADAPREEIGQQAEAALRRLHALGGVSQ